VKLKYSTKSLKQLEKIHAFIARHNPDAAASTIEQLLDAADLLLENPRLGRIGRKKGTRELNHPPFVIVYQQLEVLIYVTAVFHGNQRF
jgi:addiction module RelE/StbE family toxin